MAEEGGTDKPRLLTEMLSNQALATIVVDSHDNILNLGDNTRACGKYGIIQSIFRFLIEKLQYTHRTCCDTGHPSISTY